MSFNELLDKGRVALEEGDGKAALQVLQQALKLQQSAEAWHLLAEAELEEGLLGRARKSLAKGLELEPDNIELLYSLGDLCLEEEQGDEALRAFERIIALDREEIDAWVSKALVLLNADDLGAAETVCRQALTIEPSSVFALNALGDICAAAGKSAEARANYEKAIEAEPDDPQAYLNLGDLCYEAGRLKEAEEYCKKGLECDAGLPMGYLTLGYVYMDQDRSREAGEQFRQFLRLEKSPAARDIRDEVKALLEDLK